MATGLISKKELHKQIREKDLQMANAFPEQFEKEVQALLKRCMKRATANDRKTVLERDI